MVSPEAVLIIIKDIKVLYAQKNLIVIILSRNFEKQGKTEIGPAVVGKKSLISRFKKHVQYLFPRKQ